MGCIEARHCEILASYVSFAECRNYIKEHCKEYYDVKPGYHIFDVYIIGIPPIYIGVDGDSVIFPYTKPCHGTFILKAMSPEEIERLRAAHG